MGRNLASDALSTQGLSTQHFLSAPATLAEIFPLSSIFGSRTSPRPIFATGWEDHNYLKLLNLRFKIQYCSAPAFGTPLVIAGSDVSSAARLVQLNMAPIAEHTRLTVLLADDQERWHQTVRGLLEPQGVQTISARSGREALQKIESQPIHVVVLDHQMPQLGGLQVIKLMRELHKSAPPAILLANDLTSHLLREALGMHVFSVLSKPVDPNQLLDALARVMRRFYESRWPGGNEDAEKKT